MVLQNFSIHLDSRVRALKIFLKYFQNSFIRERNNCSLRWNHHFLLNLNSLRDLGIKAKIKIWTKNSINFTFPWIGKIAQHLQIDKIYHQKEQKISYLEVYIANLGRAPPGKAVLGWKSTGLLKILAADSRLYLHFLWICCNFLFKAKLHFSKDKISVKYVIFWGS